MESKWHSLISDLRRVSGQFMAILIYDKILLPNPKQHCKPLLNQQYRFKLTLFSNCQRDQSSLRCAKKSLSEGRKFAILTTITTCHKDHKWGRKPDSLIPYVPLSVPCISFHTCNLNLTDLCVSINHLTHSLNVVSILTHRYHKG